MIIILEKTGTKCYNRYGDKGTKLNAVIVLEKTDTKCNQNLYGENRYQCNKNLWRKEVPNAIKIYGENRYQTQWWLSVKP